MKKRELFHLGIVTDDKLDSFVEQGHSIDAFDQAHLAYMYMNELSCPLFVLKLCMQQGDWDLSVPFENRFSKLVCFSSIASDILPCLDFICIVQVVNQLEHL